MSKPKTKEERKEALNKLTELTEDYGLYRPEFLNTKPTVPVVTPLVALIYKGSREKSCVGCCLHIAMDDGNIDDQDIDFCLLTSRVNDHADCEHVATLLSRMTRTQRKKVYMTWRKLP